MLRDGLLKDCLRQALGLSTTNGLVNHLGSQWSSRQWLGQPIKMVTRWPAETLRFSQWLGQPFMSQLRGTEQDVFRKRVRIQLGIECYQTFV